MNNIQYPTKRLSKDMVKVWWIREVLSLIIGIVVLIGLFYASNAFNWPKWLHIILIIGTIIYGSLTILGFVRPYFLHKNWRFDVDEQFLQLKQGAFLEEQTLVPMTKIQSVSTKEGPILRKYDLCSITVDTMGSSHTIPGLPKDDAISMRNTIAIYAKLKEVEQ